MNIAYVVESAAAGVGRHVIDLALGLSSAGHKIHVIHSANRMDARFREGIRLLDEAHGRSFCLPIKHAPHPSDLSVVYQIQKYLKVNGPFEIVHCHSTKAGLVGRIASFGTGSKIVYTPHAFLTMSPHTSKFRHFATGLIEWNLAHATSAIICVSEEERRHALSLGISEHRLFHVPNGIDQQGKGSTGASGRAGLRHKFGLSQSDIAIGFVGRLYPQKNPELLVKAFASARPNLPDTAKLVIVGDGPLRPSIENSVRELGIAENTVLAGDADGQAAMAAFDLFALSSQYEAFPYVLIEAIAAGLPVVTTEVGGASSLIHHQANGLRTTVGSVDEFARALITLCCQPEIRSSMSMASLEIAKQYTTENMLLRLGAVYSSVLHDCPVAEPADATARH